MEEINGMKVESLTHEPSENEVRVIQLRTIAAIVQSWVDWSKYRRDRENIITEDGTSIMALPVPCWPTHGQLKEWVKCLNEIANDISQKEKLQ